MKICDIARELARLDDREYDAAPYHKQIAWQLEVKRFVRAVGNAKREKPVESLKVEREAK